MSSTDRAPQTRPYTQLQKEESTRENRAVMIYHDFIVSRKMQGEFVQAGSSLVPILGFGNVGINVQHELKMKTVVVNLSRLRQKDLSPNRRYDMYDIVSRTKPRVLSPKGFMNLLVSLSPLTFPCNQKSCGMQWEEKGKPRQTDRDSRNRIA